MIKVFPVIKFIDLSCPLIDILSQAIVNNDKEIKQEQQCRVQ